MYQKNMQYAKGVVNSAAVPKPLAVYLMLLQQHLTLPSNPVI